MYVLIQVSTDIFVPTENMTVNVLGTYPNRILALAAMEQIWKEELEPIKEESYYTIDEKSGYCTIEVKEFFDKYIVEKVA